MNADEVEREGMWLVSPAGVSFACKCGWRSGICGTQERAAERLWAHIDSVHTLGEAQETKT